jgi:hypothetical protein
VKNKSIMKICISSKQVILMDKVEEDRTEQWVGNGYAIYQLQGMPYVEIDNLLAINDVPESTKKKIFTRHEQIPDGMSFDDCIDDELPLVQGEIRIEEGDCSLIPLQTEDRIIFINSRYLAPLCDESFMLRFFERVSLSGKTYIAVKSGYLLRAIIMPYMAITPEFINRIAEFENLCEHELLNQRKREIEKEVKQTMMFVDRGTGEVIEGNENEGSTEE